MWRPTLLSTGGRWFRSDLWRMHLFYLLLSCLSSSLFSLSIFSQSLLYLSLLPPFLFFPPSLLDILPLYLKPCLRSIISLSSLLLPFHFWGAAIQVLVSLSWKLLGSDRDRRQPAGRSWTWLSLSLPSDSWLFQQAPKKQKKTTRESSIFERGSPWVVACLFLSLSLWVSLFTSFSYCFSPSRYEVSLQVKWCRFSQTGIHYYTGMPSKFLE